MKIGIIVKPHRTEFSPALQDTLDWLKSRGCTLLIEESLLQDFQISGYQGMSREQIPPLADAIVVFGGDGTILSVVRTIGQNRAPILGVNLGSLGFLTGVTLDELQGALECLIEGRYRIDRRQLLEAEVRHVSGQVSTHHALNDVVINKGALARIIRLDTFIDEDFMATFLADGMIVATPTGSTAYSLAAGGPVIYPSLDSTVLTPICPHTLTNRPVVIPASSKIRISLKVGEDVALTVDGQIGVALQEEDEIVCTRADRQIELIQPSDKGFFDVLREKLKWAERGKQPSTGYDPDTT